MTYNGIHEKNRKVLRFTLSFTENNNPASVFVPGINDATLIRNGDACVASASTTISVSDELQAHAQVLPVSATVVIITTSVLPRAVSAT